MPPNSSLLDTKFLLFYIRVIRARMCRWQRCVSHLSFQKALGKPVDADLEFSRKRLTAAILRLAALRLLLKEINPRAWRIHTFGLDAVLETEQALSTVSAGEIPETMGLLRTEDRRESADIPEKGVCHVI